MKIFKRNFNAHLENLRLIASKNLHETTCATTGLTSSARLNSPRLSRMRNLERKMRLRQQPRHVGAVISESNHLYRKQDDKRSKLIKVYDAMRILMANLWPTFPKFLDNKPSNGCLLTMFEQTRRHVTMKLCQTRNGLTSSFARRNRKEG